MIGASEKEAIRAFLEWCARQRKIYLVEGQDSDRVDGEELSKLLNEWIASTNFPVIDAEIVEEPRARALAKVPVTPDMAAIDAQLAAALGKPAQPAPTFVATRPVPPPAAPLTPYTPSGVGGRPCAQCRGSGMVPSRMASGQMLAVECPACQASGVAPVPKVRGTSCSCPARSVSPICAVHGAECICPEPTVLHPQCPLHSRQIVR